MALTVQTLVDEMRRMIEFNAPFATVSTQTIVRYLNSAYIEIWRHYGLETALIEKTVPTHTNPLVRLDLSGDGVIWVYHLVIKKGSAYQVLENGVYRMPEEVLKDPSGMARLPQPLYERRLPIPIIRAFSTEFLTPYVASSGFLGRDYMFIEPHLYLWPPVPRNDAPLTLSLFAAVYPQETSPELPLWDPNNLTQTIPTRLNPNLIQVVPHLAFSYWASAYPNLVPYASSLRQMVYDTIATERNARVSEVGIGLPSSVAAPLLGAGANNQSEKRRRS